MAPLVVQLVVTVVARWFVPWRDATRIGLAVMFLFTAGSHFSTLKYDLAAMIPPPLTGALWVIYVTGVLEAAGAVGLLTTVMRRPAAWGLIALLVGLFPANLYAAMTGVTVGGASATPLMVRTPLQLLWIGLLSWSTGRRRSTPIAARPKRVAEVSMVVIAGAAVVGCTTTPASSAVAGTPEESRAVNDGLEERPRMGAPGLSGSAFGAYGTQTFRWSVLIVEVLEFPVPIATGSQAERQEAI